jgi:glycine/D-amino acid oxidase-like deaminating enzyme
MTTTAGGQSVVIVGGGAFGIAAALELRAREWAVTLIEQGTCPDPRASSTDISKAVRIDYGADAFYTELAESALERWRIWNDEWNEPPFHAHGFLLVTRREMAAGGFEADGFALLSDRDYPVERVDRETLQRRFPAWKSEAFVDGYFNPHGGWAESGRCVASLGVAMHPNDPQEVGSDRIERFRTFLSETFHGLGGAELVGSRLCLYCDTWDGNFWIDHHPQLDGLMVACGGSGHGFKFVPVLGEIIADVLERKPNRWADRFAWREPQTRVTEQARSLTD